MWPVTACRVKGLRCDQTVQKDHMTSVAVRWKCKEIDASWVSWEFQVVAQWRKMHWQSDLYPIPDPHVRVTQTRVAVTSPVHSHEISRSRGNDHTGGKRGLALIFERGRGQVTRLDYFLAGWTLKLNPFVELNRIRVGSGPRKYRRRKRGWGGVTVGVVFGEVVVFVCTYYIKSYKSSQQKIKGKRRWINAEACMIPPPPPPQIKECKTWPWCNSRKWAGHQIVASVPIKERVPVHGAAHLWSL